MGNLQQVIQIVLAISTFALVLSLWVGGMLLWAGKRMAKSGKVRRRLGLESSSDGERVLHLWHEGQDVTTTVPVRMGANSLVYRLERHFQRADLPLSLMQGIILVSGVVLITFAFVLVLTQNVIIAGAISLGIVAALNIYVGGRINRRTALFEAQLMDALELAARSLRAGHPLLGAFQLLSEEMSPPVSTVFAEICQRHGMGADLEQVLRETGQESSSTDMSLFATSVAIQIRTGGNLADLMERLALVIRDRMRVHRRARVLSAQTQLSKRVLIALPIVLFVVLNVVNPNYMVPFYTELPAQLMLGAGVLLLFAGAIIMHKMSKLRY